jgi:putative redox protein
MASELEVLATWEGELAANVSARGHEVRIDEPPDVPGGENSGMMPTELFCAALASCFVLAVAFTAKKRGLEVEGLAVTVRARQAGDEPRYGRFEVETSGTVEGEELEELVRRAEPVCWVSQTLAAGVDVTYSTSE